MAEVRQVAGFNSSLEHGRVLTSLRALKAGLHADSFAWLRNKSRNSESVHPGRSHGTKRNP